ncbi:hypothetical protein BDEG_20248 [Batrachochytrium dendrobatidis JEL423]|uniref:Kinesin motor domain-containing protein n=1 Tax=Batrachochytrium dendrobatidis (strain JEL423) TaxID=403673 RepID=A0A177W7I2_BATDL|nr:hypothetical protein BDEG_20248 [Batrachochytrium dendrobatidis JEL423]
MSTSTVKVAVRVRPMAAKELLANSTECVSYISGTNQIVIGGSNNSNSSSSTNVMTVGPDSAYWMAQKSFTFDYVFDPLTTQDLLGVQRNCLGLWTDWIRKNILYGNRTGYRRRCITCIVSGYSPASYCIGISKNPKIDSKWNKFKQGPAVCIIS